MSWKCFYCAKDILKGFGCPQDNDIYRDIWLNDYKSFVRVHLNCWKDEIIKKLLKVNK